VQVWLLLTLLAILAGGGAFVAALLRFQNELPSTAHLERIEPPANTRILDRNGTPLGDLFTEDRLLTTLDRIPPEMIAAVIATEDRRFHDHWGISYIGMARAVLANLRRGRTTQGGSTITQQLARNLFLTHERTMTRKIKEALLTIRLERIYAKREILSMYLNQIYYGNGAYGVRSASREYFDKDPTDLTLEECAFLAGIPANPTVYDPRRRMENALGRQRTVLAMMVDHGSISADEAAAARAEPVRLTVRERRSMAAPYFVEQVRQYLETNYGADQIYRNGLSVATTLDLEIQRTTETALEDQLRRLEEKNLYEIVRDSTWVAPAEPLSNSPYVQGAAIVLDTKTGAVVAMVGGRDFWESRFNRATQARRQPGSAFKPFVYIAALEQGIGASTIIRDEPLVVPLPNGDVYKPENTYRSFRGPVTMRTALTKSINVPAVRMILTVSPRAAVNVARRCGISGVLHPYPSLALGASEVTLIDLASSYSVFPNLGIHHEPWFIQSVADRNGTVLETGRPTTREALAAPVAAVMTNLLEGVVDRGTASSVRWKGFRLPAGGKTGTMDDYMDALFVGFTPQYTMAVWVGFDVKKTLGEKMTGSAAALPVWIEVMKAAHANLPDPPPFEVPDGVVWLEVCPESGLLAKGECVASFPEIFVQIDAPDDTCPIHGEEAAYDAQTGDLQFDQLDRDSFEGKTIE
jgi:penicillin-binding protein 1A